MPTEEQLRAVLAARAEQAPDPEVVMGGMRDAAHRRRRRAVATVAAATVAVALAITLPVLIARGAPETAGPGDDPAAADPAASPQVVEPRIPFDPADKPPFAFTINEGTVAGVEFSAVSAGPVFEAWNLTPVGAEQPEASLVVYRADADVDEHGWDVTAPTPTEVGGAPAWFSATDEVSALRWEYAPGAFAVLTSPAESSTNPPMTEEGLRELAGAVEFAAPYPVKLPYRLDYLPAGMKPSNVTQLTGEGEQRSTLQLASDDHRFMDITIGGEDWFDNRSEWDWQDTTIAGYPAQCTDLIDGRRCEVEVDGLTISFGAAQLTDEDAAQLLVDMTLATWEDPGTWYDLDEALPLD